MQSTSRDTTDLLRSAGGLLFAAGAATLFARKGAGETWGSLPLLLVLLLPVTLLYGLAISGVSRASDRRPESWRSVLLVASLLLAPFAFLQFLEVIGADTNRALWFAAAFAFTATLAAQGVRRARVRYAALLAGLALLVAWMIVWGKALEPISGDTFRVLLVGGAVLLFLIGTILERRGKLGATEVATAGGIAAVLAGMTGVVIGAVNGAARGLEPIFNSTHTSHRLVSSGLQSFGWDLYLLAVSVALVALGARARSRGMGYVGGFGVLMFIISVSAQITRVQVGKHPTTSLIGWPLALLLLGLFGLVISARRSSEPE
jgi:hypothetical protein